MLSLVAVNVLCEEGVGLEWAAEQDENGLWNRNMAVVGKVRTDGREASWSRRAERNAPSRLSCTNGCKRSAEGWRSPAGHVTLWYEVERGGKCKSRGSKRSKWLMQRRGCGCGRKECRTESSWNA